MKAYFPFEFRTFATPSLVDSTNTVSELASMNCHILRYVSTLEVWNKLIASFYTSYFDKLYFD